jgi:hypothetical protein
MFFSDTELITLSAVRRVVQNVGKEAAEKRFASYTEGKNAGKNES